MTRIPALLTRLSRGRLILLALTAAFCLAVIGVGTYGLVTGPTHTISPSTTPGPSTVTLSNTPTASSSSTPGPRSIPDTRNPDQFARSAAQAIFTWDTTSGLMPLDYTSAILDSGDPTGTEQAGLAHDLDAYLPTRETWLELREHSTRQHLSITKTFVPSAWREAQREARPGQLPTGATAVTIEATRHRDGTWHDSPITAEEKVTFTIFLACPPGQSCHLLRLSALGQPLT